MEQDQVRRAAREAELVCEELTRARIDLELHGPHALRVPEHRRSSRGRRLRATTWAITLYALVTVLATGTPEVTGSTVFQPTVVQPAVGVGVGVVQPAVGVGVGVGVVPEDARASGG